VGVDDIISIEPNLPELLQLTMELSQPTYSINNAGKIVIDKMPDGMRSPNLADAVMIAYGPATRVYEIWSKLAS
jgi:phage terminase large subunit